MTADHSWTDQEQASWDATKELLAKYTPYYEKHRSIFESDQQTIVDVVCSMILAVQDGVAHGGSDEDVLNFVCVLGDLLYLLGYEHGRIERATGLAEAE